MCTPLSSSLSLSGEPRNERDRPELMLASVRQHSSPAPRNQTTSPICLCPTPQIAVVVAPRQVSFVPMCKSQKPNTVDHHRTSAGQAIASQDKMLSNIICMYYVCRERGSRARATIIGSTICPNIRDLSILLL